MKLVSELRHNRREVAIAQISVLENAIRSLKEQFTVSDSAARELVREAFAKLKSESKRRFNVIDLHLMTRLPFDQINKVMERFEKEGLVEDGNVNRGAVMLDKILLRLSQD